VAYVGEQGATIKLDEPQDFQLNDPYSLPSSEIEQDNEEAIYSLLVDKPSLTATNTDDGYQCGVQ